MNLFSPTILVGCVGESCAAHDGGGERERGLASAAWERIAWDVLLGQERWVLWVENEWPAWCHCSGEVLGVWDWQWCVGSEGSLHCGRGVGGLEHCLLVLKSWESSLNFKQKNTAIPWAFKPPGTIS